ncbi:MAG: type II secretion system protein GspN [Nitrospirota bacterium]|nr:type II secretion system protein GspN [Nitrospirota bacterium]
MTVWPITWLETSKLKGPLGWGLATLTGFILSLLLTFPYGPLQSRLLAEFHRASGWEVRAADWSVGFPASIEWRDVVLSGPTIGAIPLEAVRTTIGVFQALFGRLVIDYVVQLPGAAQVGAGRATGSLTAASWGLRGPVSVKGHLQQMELATVLKPYVSQGTAQGDFMHRWDNTQDATAALKGDGTVKMEIKDLVVDRVTAGSAAMPSLALGRIQASLTCHDGVCDVTELKGDGVDGSFTAQGHVTLRQPLQQSLLDLTVTIIPGPGFAQKAASLSLPPFQPGAPLTFKLAGPIMNARVAL